jgi:pyrroloquinoline quinone biosynthesis protein B
MTRQLLLFLFYACISNLHAQYIQVLGVAQDGGFPHIGCQNECQLAFKDPSLAKYVVSLALVDPNAKKWWLFEATPDLPDQLNYFQELTSGQFPYLPEGIFITHAHIGHYTGLMYLGKEALGATDVKVYTLPGMIAFLKNNGPWNQLVASKNIVLQSMKEEVGVQLNERISVNAFTVPHRDEYSETAGFRIKAAKSTYLFIPDIDKWEKWDKDIRREIETVDVAFLDATFFQDGELPNRAMSEIPHPFVEETMSIFKTAEKTKKAKVHFIHFNHTNPILFDKSAREKVWLNGFNIAEQGKTYH